MSRARDTHDDAMRGQAWVALVGQELRRYRQAQELTIDQVALRMTPATHPSALRSYEVAERPLSLAIFFQYACVLDIAPHHILEPVDAELLNSDDDDDRVGLNVEALSQSGHHDLERVRRWAVVIRHYQPTRRTVVCRRDDVKAFCEVWGIELTTLLRAAQWP